MVRRLFVALSSPEGLSVPLDVDSVLEKEARLAVEDLERLRSSVGLLDPVITKVEVGVKVCDMDVVQTLTVIVPV